MTKAIHILNGPNLNLLGMRQPEIHGHATLADVEGDCAAVAAGCGLSVKLMQSNHEGQIVDWMRGARNGRCDRDQPRALTHTWSRSSMR